MVMVAVAVVVLLVMIGVVMTVLMVVTRLEEETVLMAHTCV